MDWRSRGVAHLSFPPTVPRIMREYTRGGALGFILPAFGEPAAVSAILIPTRIWQAAREVTAASAGQRRKETI